MDNYLSGYLHEHSQLDIERRRRIRHFLSQYLLKVSNICPEDALHLRQNLSPWSSLCRGDYHRFYHLNPLLEAIEEGGFCTQSKERFELCRRLGSWEGITWLGANLKVPPERRGELRDFLVEHGLTPTLQQAASLLDESVANTSWELPPSLETSSSFETFIRHPVFEQCKRSSFSARALVQLFEGMRGLDDLLKDKEMLRDSYGRVLWQLCKAMQIDRSLYWNLASFEGLLEQAHEELFFWLMMAEPYTIHDLEKAICACIAPPQLLHTASSGMAAFSQILQTLLQEQSVVLLYDGIYFECRTALLKAHPMDRLYVVEHPDYDASLEAGLQHLASEGRRVDLLFVNFHENLLSRRYRTQERPVGEIVERLLQSGRVADSLTVVIDQTIGFLDAPEVRKLLQRFAGESRVHFVIFWSHQKFDLFGFDKVSGGSFAVYSKDRKLLQAFAKCSDKPDPASLQALAHYFTAAPALLEERRVKIFANAQSVFDAIDSSLKFDGNLDKPLFVAFKEDAQNFSIDLFSKRDLEGSLCKTFWQEGIPLMLRSGFGFNLTSVAFTRINMIRFSIGLEGSVHLNKFARVLNNYLNNYFRMHL